MNKRQRQTVSIAAVVTAAMIIFPPVHMVLGAVHSNQGFSFILNMGEAEVNVSQLLVQWVAVWVVGAAVWFVQKDS